MALVTTGPRVTGSMSAPSDRASSLSGISPIDSSTVSHGTDQARSRSGRRSADTGATVTRSTRSRPWTPTTVVDRWSGMSKSWRHSTMLRLRPLAWAMSSNTPTTSTPSSVRRRAMIRPMSPEPRMATRRPGSTPSTLTNFWASPAVITPDGRSPGIRIAPRVRSRAPLASTTAPASMVRTPCWADMTVRSPSSRSTTKASVSTSTSSSTTCSNDALGVLGTGQLLAERVQAEAGVDALVEDASGLGLPVDQQHPLGPSFACPHCGRQAGRAGADHGDVVAGEQVGGSIADHGTTSVGSSASARSTTIHEPAPLLVTALMGTSSPAASSCITRQVQKPP